MASRGGKTIMEVWSFAPPAGALVEDSEAEEEEEAEDEGEVGVGVGTERGGGMGFGAIGEERARKRVQREESENVEMMDVGGGVGDDDGGAGFLYADDRGEMAGEGRDGSERLLGEGRSEYVRAQKSYRDGF